LFGHGFYKLTYELVLLYPFKVSLYYSC